MSPPPSVKAVILVAGPQKGTRFRPLSLDLPKPLFPVAGLPVVDHLLEALARRVGPALREVLLLGFFPASEMAEFAQEATKRHKVPVRYLQEYTSMGTAGGVFHFRDRITGGGGEGEADTFFVLNGDVCADFPLEELLDFHKRGEPGTLVTMMATEAARQQAHNYGCVVVDEKDSAIRHYVEKPTTYISSLINCGVYVFSKEIFGLLQEVYRKKQRNSPSLYDSPSHGGGSESMWIEKDILPALAGTGRGRVYVTQKWWSQIKTAGSAIYANRHYLGLYEKDSPERLLKKKGGDGDGPEEVIGNVFVHPSAKIHPTAVLGPNVSIGEDVCIGAGARVKESIILPRSSVGEHTLVMYAVIGSNASVGAWARVEGTPNDPNPDRAFAKMEILPLFNSEGKLNPSITVLGDHVDVPSELVVRNAVVLPHKQIGHSFVNEIIL